MSLAGDDDDVTVDEQLIAGRATPGDEALAQVLAVMRAMADGPEPRPNAALEALMAPAPQPAAHRPAAAPAGPPVWRRALRWVAGLGIAAKVALGAGVAMAATTGVATIPAVPDVVQVPVHDALARVEHFFIGPPEIVVHEPGATPTSPAVPGGASPASSGTGRSATAPAAPDEGGQGAATDQPGQDGPSAAPGSDDTGTQGGPSSQGSDSRSTTAPGGRPTLVPDDGTSGQQPGQPARPTPSPSASPDTARGGEGQQGGNDTGSSEPDSQQ